MSASDKSAVGSSFGKTTRQTKKVTTVEEKDHDEQEVEDEEDFDVLKKEGQED